MPISLIDIIKQQNRNATSGDFFFMLDSGDINFKVQGIQVDASLSPGTTTDFKYIVEDVSALNAGFGTITGVGDNDIVRYNGSAYEIFLDASNKQDGTIVFNEGDSKFYGFNGTAWQELGSGAGGGATGATGSTGATGATGATGPAGATGATGNTGNDGPRGNTGATGPPGQDGAGGGGATLHSGDGLTLSPVSAGVGYTMGIDPTATIFAAGLSLSVSGITFPDGTFQSTASSGVEGGTGATGATGATGNTGNTGNDGPRGNTGATGATGNTGNDGPRGNTGATGNTGNTGNDGPRGNTGATGATGNTGNDGPRGNTGAAVVDIFYQDSAPTGGAEGNIWFNSTSGLFFIYVDDGDSEQWVQIVGSRGPTGATGQDGSVGSGGGGTTLAAGAGVTLTSIVAGVGHTLGIDPTAVVHVAGVSSDGGATFGGSIIIPTGLSITNTQSSSLRPTVKLSTSEVQIDSKSSGTPGRITVSGSQVKTRFVPFVSEQLINAQAGISMDAAGITFADSTHQTTAVNPTAVIHVAGISADGGITASGRISTDIFGSETTTSFIQMDRSGDGSGTIGFNPGGNFSTLFTPSLMYSGGNISIEGTSTLTGLVTASSGITLGKGITFPDGTHQATAGGAGGTGYVAGAGLSLDAAGGTFSIDSAATIHVAGISVDGGITAGAIGINNVTNEITMPLGGRILTSGNHNVYFPTDGVQIQAGGSSNNSFEVVTGRAIVNSSLLLHTRGSGISMDQGGITFADGTHQTTAVNPTAVVHVAGISSDGGITVGNLNINGYRIKDPSNATDFVDFGANKVEFYQDNTRMLKINGDSSVIIGSSGTPKPFQVFGTQSNSDLITTAAGISMDTAGITFPDGTHQSTAAAAGGTGYIAGAGLALDAAGGTFSIDPTAVIHVAGISADGSIVIPAGNSYGWNDGCFITTASGALRFSANSGYYGVQLSSSTFSVYRDAFFEDGVHVAGAAGISGDKGIKLGGGITFPDGTFQSTASNNAIQGVTYVAGFLFDGRGVTVAAAKKTDIVRPIEGTATIAELGIRLPEGAGGGTASASVYKVGSNYINTSGLSLAADGITVGTIDLQNGLYGGTASGGGTMANGDLIYCGVTGAGLGKIVQVFVTYEV